MATLTVYPNAEGDPTPTSVDGVAGQSTVHLSWSEIRAAAGTYASQVAVAASMFIVSSTVENKWYSLSRCIFLFDTSALPDGAIISAATLYLYGISGGKKDDLGISPTYNIYAPLPASNIAIVAGDFDSFSSVPLCDTPITYANWKEGIVQGDAENSFVLNAAGLALISKTGITYLGIREATYDVGGATPSWSSNEECSLTIGTAEATNALWRPKLVITYATSVDVTTDAASSIASATATLNGTLDDEGSGACTCGFDYGTTVAYGTQVQAAGTYNTGQSFLKAIASLLPGTTYHARAYADNGVDAVAYGADVTFTTLGVVYPSQTITRVTSLVHRYHRKQGIYSLELNLGGVTSDFGIPVWSSMFQSAASPTVPPTEEAIEEIVRRLNTGIIKTEGFQIPTLTPESVQPTKPIMYIQTPEDLQSYKVKTAPPPSGPLIELAPKKWWEFWK